MAKRYAVLLFAWENGERNNTFKVQITCSILTNDYYSEEEMPPEDLHRCLYSICMRWLNAAAALVKVVSAQRGDSAVTHRTRFLNKDLRALPLTCRSKLWPKYCHRVWSEVCNNVWLGKGDWDTSCSLKSSWDQNWKRASDRWMSSQV